MSPEIPKSLLHYEIVGLIGAGAMGEVYRATDTKLGRDVALKILPADTGSSAIRLKRFKREARTVAGLNHPNIVTLHSVEEMAGINFITMELVEGQGLDKLVVAGGGPVTEVVAIGLAVAEALETAHAQGVVHRDLKPANIMMTREGRVKVLDFGLAKLAVDEPEEAATMDMQLTNAGAIVGTVPYLAPEQARGETSDHRADIWSLGVILYELLTGQRPFRGDNTAATMHRIITADPAPLNSLRPDVPANLAAVVSRSLTRGVGARYQRATELVTDLRAVRQMLMSGSSLGIDPVLPALAVLPFSGLRPDPDTDYLGFALADQVIGALAYIKSLRIKPSSAIRKYQGQAIDPADVARDLQVDYILTGYYLKEADTVRLNVELVKPAGDEMVWRESIEVLFDNVFQLQDIVSEKVVHGLEIQFPDEARDRADANAPKDPAAYDLYLRSLSCPHTVEGDRQAIDMLRQSLALGDAFAPAHAALGFRLRNFALQAIKGLAVYEEAEAQFQRALSLDPGHLPALAGLAGLKGDLGHFDQALPLLERMFEVNPNHALGHYVLHSILRATGLLEASKKVGERALELDPGNPKFSNLAYVHFYSGDYDRALELFKLDPESYLSICWTGFAKFMLGDREEGERLMWKGVEHEPDGHLGHHFGALVHGWRGEFAQGRELAAQWEATDPFDPESLYNMVNTWAVLEDEEACIRILEKVVGEGFCCYPYLMSDPLMATMRQVPAVQDLIEQARIKHEAFRELYRASGLPEAGRV